MELDGDSEVFLDFFFSLHLARVWPERKINQKSAGIDSKGEFNLFQGFSSFHIWAKAV